MKLNTAEKDEKWQTAGTIPAGSAPAGTVAQYQYQYNPSKTDVGEIYFASNASTLKGTSFTRS